MVAYGFLFGYRQVQELQERVNRLEREKQETETLLLSFMESMNDLAAQKPSERADAIVEEQEPSPPIEESIEQVETSTGETVSVDVDDVLLRHSLKDAARILGKGEGELALYAKLRKK
nr:hypothetical protein [Exiguobacterium qingdaonense]